MSYRIDPKMDLTGQARAVACEQLDQAVALLEGGAANRHEAIHLSRRRFKRIRALLRLLRSADRDFVRAENIRYRDTAHTLSVARDAAALVEAFDAIVPDLTGAMGAQAVAQIRAALVERRDRLAVASSDIDKLIEEAISQCHAGRAALNALNLPKSPRPAARLVAGGAAASYKKARKALAAAEANPVPGHVHELRKRVNDHLFHLRLLQDLDRQTFRPRRKQISTLAKALGHHHDLCVMRDRLRAEPDLVPVEEDRTRLDALLSKRVEALGHEIILSARPLFADKPEAWRRTIERLYLKAER